MKSRPPRFARLAPRNRLSFAFLHGAPTSVPLFISLPLVCISCLPPFCTSPLSSYYVIHRPARKDPRAGVDPARFSSVATVYLLLFPVREEKNINHLTVDIIYPRSSLARYRSRAFYSYSTGVTDDKCFR